MKRKCKSFIAALRRYNGKFSGLEQVYHPPPSGGERWIDGFEDKREWYTINKAIDVMEKGLVNAGHICTCCGRPWGSRKDGD